MHFADKLHRSFTDLHSRGKDLLNAPDGLSSAAGDAECGQSDQGPTDPDDDDVGVGVGGDGDNMGPQAISDSGMSLKQAFPIITIANTNSTITNSFLEQSLFLLSVWFT